MSRVGWLLLPLALTVLAGCLGEGEDATVTKGLVPVPRPVQLDLASPSGAVAYDYDVSFAMAHPFRLRNLATHENARAYLLGELAGMGLNATRHEYGTGANIVAVKPGLDRPDEWVVAAAHYDTTEETVYGAWDNGAGSSALLALAQALAPANLSRTHVLVWTDEEEQGLVGSRAWVREFVDNVTEHRVVAMLNMDAPSLNWPCRNAHGVLPLRIFQSGKGSEAHDQLRGLVNETLAALELPAEAYEHRTGRMPIVRNPVRSLEGTSDHRHFDDRGIPFFYLLGTPYLAVNEGLGLRTYQHHNPIDTLAQMEAHCGGSEPLRQGFQTALDVAWGTLLRLDAAETLPGPDAQQA